jgi:dihydrofolate reductase
MRKIKLQMQISLDGHVAGPNGEMDWMVWNWDEALKTYATELTKSADTFLLGRKTGEGMAVYWPTVASNPESKEEDLWIADKLNTLPKVVFSKTVSTINWTNVTIASDVAKEVAHLKQQPGKDMILYGGAGIVSSFIQQNLIDEYHLFVNPVIIGGGKTIFNNLDDKLKLKLIQTTPSSTGIVILCYQPEGKAY